MQNTKLGCEILQNKMLRNADNEEFIKCLKNHKVRRLKELVYCYIYKKHTCTGGYHDNKDKF